MGLNTLPLEWGVTLNDLFLAYVTEVKACVFFESLVEFVYVNSRVSVYNFNIFICYWFSHFFSSSTKVSF